MSYVPDYYDKDVLILGCGNPLFGDDGFGPAVVEYIKEHCRVPSDVAVIDVGTSIREILFNFLLFEKKPKTLVIVDALDCGRTPGETFKASIEEIPEKKIHDFSLHLMPTLNLLKELRDLAKVETVILAAQPSYIPEEVEHGLSEPVKKAMKDTAEYIEKTYLS